MFVVEKGPNQNDPNYANYLYKTDQRLLQYLKDNLPECKVDRETWPGIASIMIMHDAFIAPIMIRQKVDTIYEIVYKAYTYGHGVDKNLVLNYKPSRFVQNLIGEADDIVYYAYPHPDKNVMINIRMLGRVFSKKKSSILKKKEYNKEVTKLETILPFVIFYLHKKKKALK